MIIILGSDPNQMELILAINESNIWNFNIPPVLIFIMKSLDSNPKIIETRIKMMQMIVSTEIKIIILSKKEIMNHRGIQIIWKSKSK